MNLRDVHFLRIEQFNQIGWVYFYLYSFLHRLQKCNNITIIIVWPVSSAGLNVKGAFIFSLYGHLPMIGDQYLHTYQAWSIHILFVYCLCGSQLFGEVWLDHWFTGYWVLKLTHLKRAVQETKYSPKGPLKYNFFAISYRAHINW